MRKAGWVALLLLTACAQDVTQKEDMLAAAGFSFRGADTPQKAAALRALPAHQFVHEMRNGKPVWIYADPSVCACVYAGDDAAYRRYQQEVFAKQIADERVQAAQLNERAAAEQSAMVMDWAVWGPWAPYYGY